MNFYCFMGVYFLTGLLLAALNEMFTRWFYGRGAPENEWLTIITLWPLASVAIIGVWLWMTWLARQQRE